MQIRHNKLLDQLNKLVLVDDVIPLNKDFLLGYILKDISSVTPQTIKDLTKVIELLFDVQDCQIISKSNFYEIIIVFSHVCENFEKHCIKNLMDYYEKCIGEIVNDPQYLKNKFFHYGQKIKKNEHKIEEPKPQQKIVELQVGNLVRNNSDLAQCPVCFVQINHQNISVLACGHIIHRECFEQCMKESILNKRFPLKCPFQECKKHIETLDIEEYINKELVQKFYEFTLHNFVDKNSKNMSWCPTPGCTNAFEFDEGISNLNCVKCSKSYCLKCKTDAHPDISCQQNQEMMNLSQEDKKFLDFVKGAKYKQCPKCKFWVQKNHGCCHMTCRCTYEFCYVCGGKHGDCNCQSQYENYYGSPEGSQLQDDDMNEEDEERSYISEPQMDPALFDEPQNIEDSNRSF